jgi:hypothetical protein
MASDRPGGWPWPSATTLLGRPVEQVLARALGLAERFSSFDDDPVPDRPAAAIPADRGQDPG